MTAARRRRQRRASRVIRRSDIHIRRSRASLTTATKKPKSVKANWSWSKNYLLLLDDRRWGEWGFIGKAGAWNPPGRPRFPLALASIYCERKWKAGGGTFPLVQGRANMAGLRPKPGQKGSADMGGRPKCPSGPSDACIGNSCRCSPWMNPAVSRPIAFSRFRHLARRFWNQTCRQKKIDEMKWSNKNVIKAKMPTKEIHTARGANKGFGSREGWTLFNCQPISLTKRSMYFLGHGVPSELLNVRLPPLWTRLTMNAILFSSPSLPPHFAPPAHITRYHT